MKNQDVYNIAVNFRKAIIEAKANRLSLIHISEPTRLGMIHAIF